MLAGHGTCNSDGTCTCAPTHYGPACSLRVPVVVPHGAEQEISVSTGGWGHYMAGNLDGVPPEYNQKLITVTTKQGNPWFYAREGAVATLTHSLSGPIKNLPATSSHTFLVSASNTAYTSMYAPCCTKAAATIRVVYAKGASTTCQDYTDADGDKWLDSTGDGCSTYNSVWCPRASEFSSGGLDARFVVSCVYLCVMSLVVCVQPSLVTCTF
jgi:hypothetical protein